MATIRKRGNSYQALVRAKGYPTQSQNFRYKADATKWARKIEVDIEAGKFFPAKRKDERTLADAIDRYLKEDVNELADSADRRRQLNWWKDQLGDISLLHLCNDLDLLHDAKRKLETDKLKKGTTRAPPTVKRYLAALSRLFSCAVDWDWCDTNPVRRIRKPKESPGRNRYLSDDERQALLKATVKSDDPYLHTLVLIALCTGGRAGEIQGLTWPDVSLQRKTVTFRHTKNRQVRTVPVTDQVVDRFRELSRIRRIDSELVFPRYDGVRPKSFRAAWDKAVAEARLKDFRFHDLRHTAASYLAMSGASPSELAAILGHKTLAMVARYSHVGEQHTADILKKMTNKFLADGQ
jgi:integrase